MTEKGRGLAHPALVYLVLLIIVVLASWTGSIFEFRKLGVGGGLVLRSALSVQGIRWMVRSAAANAAQAPFGNAIMLLMAIGACKSSGLNRALTGRRALSPKESTALTIALTVFAIYLILLLLGTLTGSRLLLGMTGTVKGSPLATGAVFLLMLAVVLPSMVYGLATGTLRTAHDCIEALSDMIRPMASLLVTMLIASWLIETFRYTHMDTLIGIGPQFMAVVEFLIYWIPLPIILLRKGKKAESDLKS